MKLSLRVKMIGATVLLLFFIVALYAVVAVRVETSELADQTERIKALHTLHARTIGLRTASAIASGSDFLIADNDFGTLEDKLVAARAESKDTDLPITDAVIIDPKGAVLVPTPKDGESPKKLDVGDFEGLESSRAELIDDENGVPVQVVATAPIIDRNKKLWGYARFTLALAGLSADLAEVEVDASKRRDGILVRSALIGSLVVLLGLVITVLQALAITNPIIELARSASRIAEGDIDVRVSERSRDEIGEMARSFNHMAERIRQLLVDTAAKTAMERELEVARIIQETLLPPRGYVETGNLELAGFLESASLCGGDYWSYADLGEDRTLLCVGDVTGHGVPSAMITAACKSGLETLQSVTRGRFKVSYLLDELNRTIYAAARRKFAMTFFAAIVDRHTGLMEFANAGHNFPILVRRVDGEVTAKALVSRGNRLGDRQDSRYTPAETALVAGDLLCLYTDGITEYRNQSGRMYGERRLRRLLQEHVDKRPDEIIGEIMRDLDTYAGGAIQEDDVTIVIARYRGNRPMGGIG